MTELQLEKKIQNRSSSTDEAMLPVRQSWGLSVHARALSSYAPLSLLRETLSKKARQALREARQLAKKEKSQQGRKKVKKGGMTHHFFRDAVSVLRSENKIQPLENLGVTPLEAGDMENESIVSYNPASLPLLKGLNVFKRYQHHELFESPISVVSLNTRLLLDNVLNDAKNTKENRHFLRGERGVGKSTLLAQAHALAYSKYKGDVVMLHFESPENIVNGTSNYLFNKEKGVFQQPMFTKRWIGKTRFVNEKVFRKMPLTKDIEVSTEKSSFKLKKGSNTVYDFLLRSRDFAKATSAFDLLWEQLQHHSEKFPVICTIDNFNGLISKPFTEYRHTNYTPIHLTEFEMGNYLLDLVTGDLSFKKGAVIACDSSAHANTKTLTVGLGLEEYDPYSRKAECDKIIAQRLLKNGKIPVVNVKNLTTEEARSLVLFYGQAGVLKVRDYPYKETIVMPEDTSSASLMKLVGALPQVIDAEYQFERLIKSTFNVSQGNPGHLLKAAAFDC